MTEKKTETKATTEEKVTIIKRIANASVRCGKAGWTILAYLGEAIVRNHRIAKLGFFRKTGVIFLGLIALIFSVVSFPLNLASATVELGMEKIVEVEEGENNDQKVTKEHIPENK